MRHSLALAFAVALAVAAFLAGCGDKDSACPVRCNDGYCIVDANTQSACSSHGGASSTSAPTSPLAPGSAR